MKRMVGAFLALLLVVGAVGFAADDVVKLRVAHNQTSLGESLSDRYAEVRR